MDMLLGRGRTPRDLKLVGTAIAAFALSLGVSVCDHLLSDLYKWALFSLLYIFRLSVLPISEQIVTILSACAAFFTSYITTVPAMMTIYVSLDNVILLVAHSLAYYTYDDGPLLEERELIKEKLVFLLVYFVVAAYVFDIRDFRVHTVAHVGNCDEATAGIVTGLFVCLLPVKLYTGLNVLEIVKQYQAQTYTWHNKLRVWRVRLLYSFKQRTYHSAILGDFKRSIGDHLPVYTHDPLLPGQIRLFHIPQRKSFLRTGFPSGDLIHLSLKDAGKYEALSYMCGDAVRRFPIMVNGKRFLIARNLYKALFARQSLIRERFLWVDALCINQNDPGEKAQQILLMKSIFSGAFRVVGYLGESFDSNLAVSMVEEMSHSIEMSEESILSARWHYHVEQNGPEWQALCSVTGNQYFRRAWCFQEIVLAKELLFQIGQQYVDGDGFLKIMNLLANQKVSSVALQYRGERSEGKLQANHISLMARAMSFRKRSERARPLASVLSACRDLAASQPVDKIFAVLGVIKGDDVSIVPDYSHPMERQLIHTAESILLSSNNVSSMLPNAGIANPRTSANLPSWVPDWTLELPTGLLSIEFEGGVGMFRAAGDTTPQLSVQSSAKILTADGCIIDSVTAIIGSAMQIEGRISSESPTLRTEEWLAQARQLANAHISDPYFTHQPLQEAFWRTLVTDEGSGQRPAPSEYGDYYAAFMLQLQDNKPKHGDPLMARLCQAAMRKDVTLALSNAFNLWVGRFSPSCALRRFCVTEAGRMALVPSPTKAGDVIALIYGHQVPFVLRQVKPVLDGDTMSSGPVYQLVGECYVHGVMHGEALPSLSEDGTLPTQKILIV